MAAEENIKPESEVEIKEYNFIHFLSSISSGGSEGDFFLKLRLNLMAKEHQNEDSNYCDLQSSNL